MKELDDRYEKVLAQITNMIKNSDKWIFNQY